MALLQTTGQRFLRQTCVLPFLASLLVACNDAPPQYLPGGDPESGRQLIGFYDCGSCHVIPGVRNAKGVVGPPLDFWSRRSFIAGSIPNRPDELVRWIKDPQDLQPGTAMPDLGVSEAEARDIAAYLFTLD